MQNYWLKINADNCLSKQFHWMFTIRKNGVFHLPIKTVKVSSKPDLLQSEEKLTVTFDNVTIKDAKLLTFLADFYLGEDQTGCKAYLRLADKLNNPIETWSFNLIKVDEVNFGQNVKVTFVLQLKEYRDFLKKTEIYK